MEKQANEQRENKRRKETIKWKRGKRNKQQTMEKE
jgi:hypothetical protein